MAVTELNTIRSRAPAVVLVGLLLATCLLLLLAATVANASRPLKVSYDDGAQHTVESPPVVGYIQTVVVGTTAEAEQDGGAAAGHRLMNVDMLGGIKDSGPSPGVGH
ncbi:hypothetical protein BDA96_10G261900 [Sorghum bicolor]|jgi:hypothetical protein|uniref:Uncharacterized protein n=2 Tax=Sorghum bicolor TaxID=4558 RepID=A0A194YKG0_SORBI|nr:uncharacterized protein LOC110431380 [Sorghum bicolor]KAG0515240.1 hypothetical protein BDA96_10G261900 [Sorghum bicolor]KXG20437.1 hypothetical protein SORBI_3010G201200 [Sorghum bicolor]OQU76750.1 hypothetical protein SORBI_3010G201200 [Sorghum bicolor]|eukprot:XP_021306138.1 uncharacterized protein LOC110431380 [Sorghum bicolor]